MSRGIFIAVLLFAAPAFAETRFFAEIPDLPLPPGFLETSSADGFTGAEGSLVMAEAEGAESGHAVRDFYLETLPQLGWGESVEDGALVFLRGRERLRFIVLNEGGRTRLRAHLAISPASMRVD